MRTFISYSHKDDALRAALNAHLSGLVSDGFIEIWHDRAIEAGTDWESEVQEQLESADLVLLLVSSDFLASPFCIGREMKRALELHSMSRARVVPVILRPVDWQTAPFAKLQALPTNGKPVTTWLNQDEAFADVTRGLRRIVESIRTKRRDISAESEHEAHEAEPPVTHRGPVSRSAIEVKSVQTESVTVTVQRANGDQYKVKIPWDMIVELTTRELLEGLNIPPLDYAGHPVNWSLECVRTRHTLDSQKTLRENNVIDGDVLMLRAQVTAG